MKSPRLLNQIVWAVTIGLFVGVLGNRFLRAPLPAPEATSIESPSFQSRKASIPVDPKATLPSLPDAVTTLETASLVEIRAFLDQLELPTGRTRSRSFQRPPIENLNAATRALQAVALRRWFVRSPEDAWRYVKERAHATPGGVSWVETAITVWGEHDPHAAAKALTEPDFPQSWRNTVEKQLIERLIEDDPKLALTLTHKYQLGDHRHYSSIFRRLAIKDPSEAASMAESLPPIPATPREWALSAVAQQWARSDGAAAIAWFKEAVPNHSDGEQIRGFIGRGWAENEPQIVVQELDRFDLSPRYKGQLLGHALAKWANRDPNAAQAWLDEQEFSDKEGAAVQQEMLRTLSRDDPAAAAALDAQVVANGHESSSWNIGSEWAKIDPEETLGWAKTLPKGRNRDNALLAAIHGLAESDPVRVIDELPQLANDLFTDESPGNRPLAMKMITALSARGLEATQTWLDQLPPVYRRGFWEYFAERWATHSPEAVIDYLSTQRTERMQVSGLQHAIHTWAQRDPEAAAASVTTFQDQETRELAAKNVASVWKLIDSKAAQEWVNSLTEPAAHKAAQSVFLSSNR